MQINDVTNQYNYTRCLKTENYKTPMFGTWYRSVMATDKFTSAVAYRNNTTLFRGDTEIPQIMDAIVKLHKNTSKIHTRFYGCSFGAEPYSSYMYLLSKYGENILSKFLPFKAMDIDKFAITKAKKGILPVSEEEFFRVQEYTGGKFNKFFNGKEIGIPDRPIGQYEFTFIDYIFDRGVYGENDYHEDGPRVRLNRKYLRDIQYSVADVMKDYKNIEPENSVTGLRNFLPYLEDEDIIKLVTDLGKHLKKDSCIILGSYDFNPDRHYCFRLTDLFFDNEFTKLPTGLGTSFVFKKI